jgi:hypothetical protein
MHTLIMLKGRMVMSRRGSLDMVMKNMEPERATKILARSLYKELRRNGFNDKDVINFSREIIECMSQEMRKETASKATQEKDRLLIG